MRDEQLDILRSPAPEARGLSHARNLPHGARASVERKEPVAPFARGSATSEAAARNVDRTRLSKKETVYYFILQCGHRGATRTEIADGTGLTGDTVRPRVLELIAETDPAFSTGRVWESAEVRAGRTVLYAGVFARDAQLRAADRAAKGVA